MLYKLSVTSFCLLIVFYSVIYLIFVPWTLSFKDKALAKRNRVDMSWLIGRFVFIWSTFTALVHFVFYFDYGYLLFLGASLILVLIWVSNSFNRKKNIVNLIIGWKFVLLFCAVCMAIGLSLIPSRFYALARMEYAHVETIEFENHPMNSMTLVLQIEQNGDIVAMTIPYFYQLVSYPRELGPNRHLYRFEIESRDEEYDVTPGRASGLVLKYQGEFFLATNEHVLLNSRKELEALAVMDREYDIAIISMRYVTLLGADAQDVALELSELTNQELTNRQLENVGLAKSHHYVANAGLSFHFSTDWKNYQNKFCFRVKSVTDPKYNSLNQGASGSPVVDRETGELVGLLHGYFEGIGAFDSLCCQLFSGPDQIRANLVQLYNRTPH